MVSHALHELHPLGVHGIASRRMAEISAVVRMWSLVGAALDPVLWQHQGLERVDWCHLLLADRVLYGFVRAGDLQEALFWLGVAFLARSSSSR